MADPVIRYTGNGNDYHAGIPMRDLSGPEYDALDADRRAIVRASPVYAYGEYRDAVKAAQAKDAAKPAADSAPAKDAGK